MRAKAAEPARNPDVSDQGWNPTTNPAVRELLDHLADELAREYIRLMKQAAEDTPEMVSHEGGNQD
jgi:hypothetical protein